MSLSSCFPNAFGLSGSSGGVGLCPLVCLGILLRPEKDCRSKGYVSYGSKELQATCREWEPDAQDRPRTWQAGKPPNAKHSTISPASSVQCVLKPRICPSLGLTQEDRIFWDYLWTQRLIQRLALFYFGVSGLLILLRSRVWESHVRKHRVYISVSLNSLPVRGHRKLVSLSCFITYSTSKLEN